MNNIKTVTRKRFNLLQNPFDIHTRNSYKKMSSIAKYTFAVLKAKQSEPFFSELYIELLSDMNRYSQLYAEYNVSGGIREGNTLSVQQLLKELSLVKIRRWEVQVRTHYPQGTAEHEAIFPNRRSPFQSGSIDTRIAATATLALALQQYPLLAATQADVLLFYETLLTQRKNQLGSKGRKKSGSAALEPQRIQLADTLYGIMGRLMHYYKNNRNSIETYFNFHGLYGARRIKETSTD
jgi:hypothetical protein